MCFRVRIHICDVGPRSPFSGKESRVAKTIRKPSSLLVSQEGPKAPLVPRDGVVPRESSFGSYCPITCGSADDGVGQRKWISWRNEMMPARDDFGDSPRIRRNNRGAHRAGLSYRISEPF